MTTRFTEPPLQPSETVFFDTKQLYQPKMTFFYKQRNTGKIIAEEEKNAWKFERFHEFIGSSDGTEYIRVLREGIKEMGQELAREDANALLEMAFEAELAAAKKNTAEGKSRRPRKIKGRVFGRDREEEEQLQKSLDRKFA